MAYPAFRVVLTHGKVLLSRFTLKVWMLISSSIYLAIGTSGHASTFASVNLCTDLLLMELPKADAVMSLGPLARHPRLSFNFRKASKYEINRASTEEFLIRKPSVLFMGSFDTRPSRARLKAAGIQIHEMQPWTGIKQGMRQVMEVGAIIAAEEKAAALVKSIETEVALLASGSPANAVRKSVIILQQQGYVVHQGAILELLEAAGLEMKSDDTAKRHGSFVRLEKLIVDAPDYLVISGDNNLIQEFGDSIMHHAALKRAYPIEKRIVLPDNLTTCAGPSTLLLIQRLRSELRRVGHFP